MAAYTKLNFKQDVEDMAPKFDLSPGAESRFARVPLELEQSGISYFKLAPDFRFPFGHTHSEQEEVYVVISGNAVLGSTTRSSALERLDAVRIPAAHEARGRRAARTGASCSRSARRTPTTRTPR